MFKLLVALFIISGSILSYSYNKSLKENKNMDSKRKEELKKSIQSANAFIIAGFTILLIGFIL